MFRPRSRLRFRSMTMVIISWILEVLALVGCSPLRDLGRTSKRYSAVPVFSPCPVHDYPNYSAGRFKAPFLAEQLTAVLKVSQAQKAPLIVLPIQELDRQNIVSSFGRYLAEQLKTELYLNDFRILCPWHNAEEELLKQMGKNPGTFTLSQDSPLIKKLVNSGVKSIVYGSYQVGKDNIYLNIRMVSLENLEVISIGTCELPKDRNILELISQRKILAQPASLASPSSSDQQGDEVSIPVRGVQKNGDPIDELPIDEPDDVPGGRQGDGKIKNPANKMDDKQDE